MNQMKEDYDDILNLDFDAKNQIPYLNWERFLGYYDRSVEKLDGMWGFTPDVFRTVTRKKLYKPFGRDDQGRQTPTDLDFAQLEKVQIPGCWNCISDKYWYYEGEAVYSRHFVYDKNTEGKRVFLRIGAANYECRIWLNGELVGRHRGGFTPFSAEITPFLQKENHIIITVNNRREKEQVPSATYDWFNYGGIYRSVELITVPKEFIQNFTAELVPDDTYHHIRFTAWMNEKREGAICRFVIKELGIEAEAETDESGKAQVTVTANPILWDCENPYLYETEVSCGEDTVTDRIGFRQIRVQGTDIFLNGKKIYLRGVCCHEESKNTGRITIDEERIQIIKNAKELGCNALRLTHYPHSHRMAMLADEMGILLWEEIPVYWALDFDNPDTYENAENQLRELIVRDRNRASVIIWSVGNENPDTEDRLNFMRKLTEVCREMDDTRLVSAACLVDINTMEVKDRLSQYVDIVAFNEYYGWYYRDYEGLETILNNTDLGKPLVITETGAGAKAGHFGGEEELFTEEHQEKVYKKQIAYTDGKIQGLFPWVLYDFVSPIRMHPLQEGKNSKGLMNMEKNYKKKAFFVLQEYYRNKI